MWHIYIYKIWSSYFKAKAIACAMLFASLSVSSFPEEPRLLTLILSRVPETTVLWTICIIIKQSYLTRASEYWRATSNALCLQQNSVDSKTIIHVVIVTKEGDLEIATNNKKTKEKQFHISKHVTYFYLQNMEQLLQG
jgi:hypothetical protein